jgi:DNA processing protein
MTTPADSLPAFTALSFLPVTWFGAIAERVKAGVPPADVFDALARVCWKDGSRRADEIRARAADAVARAEARGIRAVVWADSAYPPALAAILDPPPVLWVRGEASHLTSAPAVAVVGARAASPYGLAVAEQLAADLASRGIVVVSGLARGVDSAAHRGALTGGGVTVAVLGSGVDVIYPAEHATLAREVTARGTIVSELGPGTRPNPMFFPRRNRIISGLSRAVVVIEAGEKSGSLITARCALEQGREVLAVPGNVLTGRNRGAHALLKDGAKVVECAEDILEELDLSDPAGAASGNGARTPTADPIVSALPCGEACDLDAIVERTGLEPARLLARLFELELRGLVRRAGGGRFVRIDRPC